MNKINTMNSVDIENTIKRYSDRLNEFGYSPKTLGWVKGKQEIRFEVLTSEYNFENKSVLDIGCGFGDLNKTLSSKVLQYKYLGIDLCSDLIQVGKKQFTSFNIEFMCEDFLNTSLETEFDWAISSGIFNHKLANTNNYDFIFATMEKAFNIIKDGFSFDFISDKVDYKEDHLFYSSPEMILTLAYKFSRNVILKSNYMPFEFSLFVFKDDSFSKEDTLFNRYKHGRNI